MIEFFSFKAGKELLFPLFEVVCGFPSPAQDYISPEIDLNEVLIDNPEATFFGRVRGLSMKDADIDEGDVLVIDRSKPVKQNSLVCACVDGQFTVKTVRKHKDYIELIAENKDFPTLKVYPEQQFLVWGVVSYVIKKKS